jgi:hypothetical protein
MPTILEMLVTWYPSNSLLVSMKTEREREREREKYNDKEAPRRSAL